MRSMSYRGQVLVLAALTISLAILSTQAYVYRLSRTEASAGWIALSDYVLSIEQGSRHAVVASLVNVSRGGASSNLRENLDRWEAFVGGDYSYGRCDLNATTASRAPYSGGVWLDWGASGRGISSACADFILNLSGRGAEVDWVFDVNVTTTALVSGSYEQVDKDYKLVSLGVNVLNEGEPSLAGAITISYSSSKNETWGDASTLGDYSWRDFGNGTYGYSFTVDVKEKEDVYIRAEVYDLRGIFVQAETTLPGI
ncbi:hypothetical protein AC482_06140 [miscellaneous Crenarchaeota group-15 archaeon DG-45]|uniref:Uncharacterized protein n=1 Tax=miscellaneous Crenarchaeota group-15 archaeon DG-45 TaxID=1685127 RepID=A0A0M0BML0_9ARCH|nr:MAG: hypothetical protein AC482_06140 [miscellaneous Crenarchaeota group-15 archaeon DG-45]